MERTPFQTPRPRIESGSRRVFIDAEAMQAASAAKASWQREIWATKAVMLNSGLDKDKAFQLAAKVVGWQFNQLEQLSVRDLRALREFFIAETGQGPEV